ncbi:MAG: hypothetical protein LBS74_03315 [Oscillospiraceae bacterium]|jgi:chitinase|nr:hypothetical protein [Oscillospiraceae bacterium]
MNVMRKAAALIAMLSLMVTLLVFPAAPLSASADATNPTSGEKMKEYRVIAYVTQWDWPGTDDPMIENDAVSDVDVSKVTHINYAFGHIVNAQNDTTYSSGFTGAVDVPDPDKLRALVKLKEQKPSLKVLLSVGGWGMDGFCPIVNDATKRQNFVKSCVEIMKEYGLDGIDLDYEYPGTSADEYDRLVCPHSSTADYGVTEANGHIDGDAYLTLFENFRANPEFGWDHLLTIASGIGYDWMVACPISDYANILDFVNIMCYDIFGNWEGASNYNANLKTPTGATAPYSYELVCQRLNLRGTPKDIMNIGIPIYGRDRAFKPSTTSKTGTDAIGLGDASWFTYDQIQDLYDASNGTVKHKFNTDGSYASLAEGTYNGRTYAITYDDKEDIYAKTKWIQENGFGGGMYWDYSNDAEHGSPLTKAVWDGLNGTAGTFNGHDANGNLGNSMTYGRIADPPVISYRWVNTTATATWKSNKELTTGGETSANPATVWYNGKIYTRSNDIWDNHSCQYGYMQAFAPEHATQAKYTWYKTNVVDETKYGTDSGWGGGTEWNVSQDVSNQAGAKLNRNEYTKIAGAVDPSALKISNQLPSSKYGLPGSTVTWNVSVTGGSAPYTITNQVWFWGVKYNNTDGYFKAEKRRTGGSYPLATVGGQLATDGSQKGVLSGITITTAGQQKARITPVSNATINNASSGTVYPVAVTFPSAYTLDTYGTYYIFTQVTDSTGKPVAVFSQPVEITNAIPDPNSTAISLNKSSVYVNNAVTATASSISDFNPISYKFEVKDSAGTVVASRDFQTSAQWIYTPTTAGVYSVYVTAKNSQGGTETSSPAQLTVVQPLAITNVTPASGAVGSALAINVTAIGGVGSKLYSVYLTKGGKVYYSKAYTTAYTFSYTPTEAGTYTLRVYVQDDAGTRVKSDKTISIA